MKKIPHNPNEIIALVDDKDEIIGKTTRKEVHQTGALHREAGCYLINSKKQVLLHKRADRHIWDCSSAGHFPFNQGYREAIVREFEEELGVKLNPEEFIELGKEKVCPTHMINNRFITFFIAKKDIPIEEFKIDEQEVEEIRYFTGEEIKKLIQTKNITSYSGYLLKKYILPMLASQVF